MCCSLMVPPSCWALSSCSYTKDVLVKTSVSISETLDMERSHVRDRLDALYAVEPSALDPSLFHAQAQVLTRQTWQ